MTNAVGRSHGFPVSKDGVSRREFLQVAGRITGGALALPLLLDACGGTAAPGAAPSSAAASSAAPGSLRPSVGLSSAAGSSSASPGAKPSSLFPTYTPIKNGPKPDIPAAGPLYEDAYINFPANPAKALPAQPPGKGSTVNVFTLNFFPPPTPYAQNATWKEVNKQLNANVQMSIATAMDYPTRLATIMAGGDLPDMMWFYTPANAPSALSAAPGLAQFIEQQAADLTPYLAGDEGAKNYPYIAALPTVAWKNAGSVINGKLHLIPRSLYSPGFLFLKNTRMWDPVIGANYTPKDADDFKRIMKELNHPDKGVYATGAAQPGLGYLPLWLSQYSALFGAPNNWRLDASGKLIKDYETPEMKEAVGYVHDLWASGLFHPNTLQYASGVVARNDFVAQKWAIWVDGFQGAWSDPWRRARQQQPPFDVHMIPPFAAHAGGKVGFNLNPGQLGALMLKKASPDRIKELLSIVNWLCAPFGSKEMMLLEYGVEGTDYTMGAKGNPVLTDKSNPDANYVPWKFIAQHHSVLYLPDIPDFAKTLSDAEKVLIPIGVSDPTWGLIPGQTLSTKGTVLTQTTNSALQDIMVGRRPLSDYDQVVKDWQKNGGDQIRKEYTDQLAAAK